MADKIYCGNGKTFGQYGAVNISLCLSDLPSEHITEYNGKKYIKLTLNKKREPDTYGKTHSLEINQWKPEKKKDGQNNLAF